MSGERSNRKYIYCDPETIDAAIGGKTKSEGGLDKEQIQILMFEAGIQPEKVEFINTGCTPAHDAHTPVEFWEVYPPVLGVIFHHQPVGIFFRVSGSPKMASSFTGQEKIGPQAHSKISAEMVNAVEHGR